MPCDHCGRPLDGLSHTCNKCGEKLCKEHRLPESHDCIALKAEKAGREIKRQQGENPPWFSDNSDSRRSTSSSSQSSAESAKVTSSGGESETEHASQPREGGGAGSRLRSLLQSPSDRLRSGIALVNKPYKSLKWRLKLASLRPVATALSVLKFAVVIGVIVFAAGYFGLAPVDTSATQESVESSVSDVTESLAPEEITEEGVEQEVHEQINEVRSEEGVGTLQRSSSLQEQSQLHSQDMAQREQLTHDLPNSQTSERLRQAGCTRGSENIAQSWSRERVETAEGVMSTNSEEAIAEVLVISWINSEGHRENLLSPAWQVSGVGVTITDDGEVYATQKFC